MNEIRKGFARSSLCRIPKGNSFAAYSTEKFSREDVQFRHAQVRSVDIMYSPSLSL